MCSGCLCNATGLMEDLILCLTDNLLHVPVCSNAAQKPS